MVEVTTTAPSPTPWEVAALPALASVRIPTDEVKEAWPAMFHVYAGVFHTATSGIFISALLRAIPLRLRKGGLR